MQKEQGKGHPTQAEGMGTRVSKMVPYKLPNLQAFSLWSRLLIFLMFRLDTSVAGKLVWFPALRNRSR